MGPRDCLLQSIILNSTDYLRLLDPYDQIDFQITRRWKIFQIYGGIENIFDFRQEFPILGYDQPFGEYFDPAFNWGPTKGREFILGEVYSK
ncbi:MAG: TonB-dependent receptor [Saprospiraceae bacterium]|nr:TonB-dependent receptor [Saprospiraceae bacterium]